MPRRFLLLWAIILYLPARAQQASFSFALIADSHSNFDLANWSNVTNYVVSSVGTYNTVALLGMGDYIYNAGTPTYYAQIVPGWNAMEAALRSPGATAMALGNHDFTNIGDLTDWCASIGNLMSLPSLQNYWQTSGSGPGCMVAVQQYAKFDVGAYKFGFLTLDYFASASEVSSALAWISASEPDRQFIISTHMFTSDIPDPGIGEGGSQPEQHPCVAGENSALNCSPGVGRQDGATIWAQLQSEPRIKWILNGHIHLLKSGHVFGLDGHRVNMVALPATGNGYVSFLTFIPSAKKVNLTIWNVTNNAPIQFGEYPNPTAEWGTNGTYTYDWDLPLGTSKSGPLAISGPVATQ